MRLRLPRIAGSGLLVGLWALPLAGSLAAFAWTAGDLAAWINLLHHPQLPKALMLSLWTGTAGLLLALGCTVLITMGFHGSKQWRRLQVFLAAGLAIPHLAFTIGAGFLIMPSGLLARVIAGGSLPPQWVTTQDPAGLSLMACLALKETPFLLAMLWSFLARGDVAQMLNGHWRSARSLGHGTASVWLRVLLPQILPRLLWPIAIVWIYGATVVDMALVIGPTQPPPLAVIIWADLNNADAAINARGAAGAALLTLVLAALGLLGLLVARGVRKSLTGFFTQGPSLLTISKLPAKLLSALLLIVYALVAVMLILMSLAGHWPYPQLWPATLRLDAWQHLQIDHAPLLLSLALALATATAALALAVLWFETMPAKLDRILTISAIASLGLPALVVAGGLYRLLLGPGLTGTLAGLLLGHFNAVFAYVFIVLKGPYRAFDPRFRSVAHGLNTGHLRFWLALKAPLLKAPLLMAAAIGFSVSMVQFVPAQLMAAGRFSTLPMEAVTLASGGNRALTAAYALVLTLLPAGVFLSAHWLARPRWN